MVHLMNISDERMKVFKEETEKCECLKNLKSIC